MQWKSNARYNQPVEDGTIFTLKSDARIVIHKLHGCGERWYLSCPELSIEKENLGTEDFDEAVKKAQDIVHQVLNKLIVSYGSFVTDDPVNEIVRY